MIRQASSSLFGTAMLASTAVIATIAVTALVISSVTISKQDPVYSMENIGTLGVGVYDMQVGNIFAMRNVAAGTGIDVALDGDGNIVITSNASSSSSSMQNIGSLGIGVYDSQVGSTFQMRNIAPGSGVGVTLDGNNNIVISSSNELPNTYYFLENTQKLRAFNLSQTAGISFARCQTTIGGSISFDYYGGLWEIEGLNFFSCNPYNCICMEYLAFSGAITNVNAGNGLAISPSNVFYVMGELNTNLYTMDIVTGATTLVVDTGRSIFTRGCVWTNNSIYFISEENEITQVDLGTNAITYITNLTPLGSLSTYSLTICRGVLYYSADNTLYVLTFVGANYVLSSPITFPSFGIMTAACAVP